MSNRRGGVARCAQPPPSVATWSSRAVTTSGRSVAGSPGSPRKHARAGQQRVREPPRPTGRLDPPAVEQQQQQRDAEEGLERRAEHAVDQGQCEGLVEEEADPSAGRSATADRTGRAGSAPPPHCGKPGCARSLPGPRRRRRHLPRRAAGRPARRARAAAGSPGSCRRRASSRRSTLPAASCS